MTHNPSPASPQTDLWIAERNSSGKAQRDVPCQAILSAGIGGGLDVVLTGHDIERAGANRMFSLSIPRGEYGLVASLGKKCQPAGRLKRMGLRSFSGPFDWFASQKMREVTKILRIGADHLFLPENIRVDGHFRHCMDLQDRATGFRSIHDIEIQAWERDPVAAVQDLKAKIARRLANLIQGISDAERVLLVRLNATPEAVASLRRRLDKMFPGTRVDVLVIQEVAGQALRNEDYGVPGTIVVSGDNTPTDDEWLGSDELWKAVLGEVTLRPGTVALTGT